MTDGDLALHLEVKNREVRISTPTTDDPILMGKKGAFVIIDPSGQVKDAMNPIPGSIAIQKEMTWKRSLLAPKGSIKRRSRPLIRIILLVFDAIGPIEAGDFTIGSDTRLKLVLSFVGAPGKRRLKFKRIPA